ncbi:MAG: methyltransferase domain-containing protein [Alphaproteobacteria bacterium]|nr:methyltransferase domain-containing protein [Alphaproteobacteria bacterium]
MVRWLHREGRLAGPRHAAAFLRVPRHRFVPAAQRHAAYRPGSPLVEAGQTLSSADHVALMTGLLRIRPGDRVLEVGTGTGYQAAILAALGAEVVSIEIRPELFTIAQRNHARLRTGVELRLGDGSLGAPDRGPFQGIVLGCVPRELPAALLDQLAVGGRLVGPEGDPSRLQTLWMLERTPHGIERTALRGTWFVPMVHDPAEVTPTA